MTRFFTSILVACVLSVTFAAHAAEARTEPTEYYPEKLIVVDHGKYSFTSGYSAHENNPEGYHALLEWNLNWCVQNIDGLPDYWRDTDIMPNTSFNGPLGQLYYNANTRHGRTHMSRNQAMYMYRAEKQRCRSFVQGMRRHGYVTQ